MSGVCGKINSCFGTVGSCFSTCGSMAKSAGNCCKDFAWTPEERFTAKARDLANVTLLRIYDLLYRISFVAFVAAEITGFVFLALANQTPSPFHPTIGFSICLGAPALLLFALCILTNRREAYLKSCGLTSNEVYEKDKPEEVEADGATGEPDAVDASNPTNASSTSDSSSDTDSSSDDED